MKLSLEVMDIQESVCNEGRESRDSGMVRLKLELNPG